MIGTVRNDPVTPRRSKRDPLSTAHLEKDLGGRSLRGGIVTVAAQGVKFALRFGSTAILARLITPEEFGLIAMTAIVTGFVGLLKDSGLTQATIQREQISHAQVSTLFWINGALGMLVASLVVALSPAIAAFYGEPRLTAIACALAIPFLLSGFSVQHQALLRRQMRFKALAVIEVVSMTTGIAVAIVMGVAGFGYWSLVGQVVADAAATALAVWILSHWRPGLPVRKSGVRSLLRFGTDILTFNVINYFSRQGDNLLIGWRWGAASLGLYEKAYSLLLLPVKQINSPVTAVVVPALSRAHADRELFRNLFLGALELVTSISVPVIFIIALFADPIVLLWLGPRWAPVADLFRYLSLAGLLGAISNCSGWLLISTGRTQRFRNLGLATAPLILLTFWLALPYGAAGVAIAYSAVLVFLFPLTWIWTLHGTSIRLRDVLRTVAQPICSAMLGALAVILLQTKGPALEPLVGLLVGIGVFGAMYAGIYLLGFGKWRRLSKVLREDLRLFPSQPTQ